MNWNKSFPFCLTQSLNHFSARYKYPIFTLPILNSRVYVVADPVIASSVQRASKVLTFDPIIPEVTQRVLGLDDKTAEIVRTNISRHTGGERGFYPDIHDMVYTTLGPGDALDDLVSSSAQEFSIQAQEYADSLAEMDSKNEDLMDWMAHFVTIATARFLYGPKNPIDVNPELEQAFWDFDHGLIGLLVNILPFWTARKAWRGREALAHAFTTYLKNEKDVSGSNKIIKRRCGIAERHGWSTEMIARSELSFLFAGITNTAVTSFWIILYIVSDPDLLKEVLEELEQCIKQGDCDTNTRQISISKIKEQCPLFVSIYRETLRVGSENSSSRVVTADTILSDKYFLRKGAVVQISGGIIHKDESTWGADALEFNPRRFMEDKVGAKTEENGTEKPGQIHPAAFRSFGGGTTLCPGRHFATSEILGLAALLLLTFDIQLPNAGKTAIPAKKDNVLPIHILEPERPVKVRIAPRTLSDARYQLVL
jgi:cytochrome P450